MPRRQPPPPTDSRRAVLYLLRGAGSAVDPHAWCRAHGLEVVATFVEHQRPELNLAERDEFTFALVAAEQAGAGVIVTPTIETLASNVTEYALAHRVIERSGAVWRVVQEPEEAYDQTLVAQIRAALIAHETMIYRPKVRRGRQKLLDMGTHTGGRVPWGHQVVDGQLVAHEGERNALAELRRMRRKGASYRELAAWLTEQGFAGRGRVQPAVVRRLVLRDPKERS